MSSFSRHAQIHAYHLFVFFQRRSVFTIDLSYCTFLKREVFTCQKLSRSCCYRWHGALKASPRCSESLPPLVLSAQHFLCFSFSRVQPTDCLPSLTQLSALNHCRATSRKRRLIEHAPRHAVTHFGVVPSEKPRRVGQIQ